MNTRKLGVFPVVPLTQETNGVSRFALQFIIKKASENPLNDNECRKDKPNLRCIPGRVRPAGKDNENKKMFNTNIERETSIVSQQKAGCNASLVNSMSKHQRTVQSERHQVQECSLIRTLLRTPLRTVLRTRPLAPLPISLMLLVRLLYLSFICVR